MDDDADQASRVFAQPQVCYHIVETGLSAIEVEHLTSILTTGGAKAAVKSSTDTLNQLDVQNLTHIITNTIDFPEYPSVADPQLEKSIVKVEWVTTSVARGKQATPRQFSPDPKMFFSGMVVACADLPQGDKDAIIGYVLAVGGMYSSSITKQVTHIIALTTETEKCEMALKKDLKCKMVLPHWIDDCLKLRARIDERPYCLPNPEILLKGPMEKIPDADRADLKGASSPRPGQLPSPAATPRSKSSSLTVFRDKTVMLHEDLQIGSRLRGILEDLVSTGGGQVTGSVHRADFLICQYRESRDFSIGSRRGKDVGNLSWLYYLITHNQWTSPTRRLLHYPLPKHGVPGFNRFRISVSNYNGEARIYLENLALAAGAAFTKTMKDDNTHLITAHSHSEKCTAAKEWNIHIVNHLWLEQSYARHQVQSVANPLYTQFPPRTNLGEVVGQTEVDSKAMERHYYPLGLEHDEQDDNVVAAEPINDGIQVSGTVKAPEAPGDARAQDVPLRPLKSDGSTPRGSKANRQHADREEFQTPALSRSFLAGKENETPSTGGSRSAKAKAAAKLHELAPDIALFQKETKRVGGVIHGGRRSQDKLVNANHRKRSKSSEENVDQESDEDNMPFKKAKKTSTTSNMRLLLSGYKKWIGQPAKCESDDRLRLSKLGISVVQDPSVCTHLAAPKVIRTQKFVCALAHAPILLSTTYVDDCLSENRRLDTASYELRDPDFEEAGGYSIADSLIRARANNGHLLSGFTIYCTEDIHGGFDTYKAIAEVNGGQCVLYRARAGADAALRDAAATRAPENEDKPADVFLLSGTTLHESRLWSKFRQMVEQYGKIPRIVRHDWLLHTALSQQRLSSASHELTDNDVDR